jgi:retinoblastoma-like protein 1
VVGKNINFTDIMKHYRNQPQAASHVYRSVLLHPKGSSENSQGEKNEENTQPIKKSPPPTPTRPAATSTVVDGEERGDLILFYNSIFMDKLQAFALRFKRSKVTTDAPPLSPLPKLRAHPQSPCRKISDLHPVRTNIMCFV